MSCLIVMSKVPSPDVWRVQHRCRPVIASSFVKRHLAIILPVWTEQIVRSEIRSVPGDVVTVFVIQDSGIVRSVGSIGAACSLHERTILHKISTRPKMNLAVR